MSKILKIALSGANGRMGTAITTVAKQDPEVDILIKLIRSTSNTINFLELLTEKNIDVFIDFSTPKASLEYLKACQELQIPMVIGTSGFNGSELKIIASAAEHFPILHAPNMSYGANIFYALLYFLSKMWVDGSGVIDIKEVHHQHKKDSPSGTALKMEEIIKQYSSEEVKVNFVSKRIGNVKGQHQVKFSSKTEELSIKHNVKSRNCFAKGALIAAKWLSSQQNIKRPYRLYNFLDVMNFTIDR